MEPTSTPPADELSLAEFLRPLARRWRTIAAGALVGALLALGAALMWPRSYTAEVSFTPEQAPGGLLGGSVAGALGGLSDGIGSLVGLPGGLPSGLAGGGAGSPEFFASLLKSRELVVTTLESPFSDPQDASRKRALLELLKPRGATPARRLGNARRKLDSRAVVKVDRRSGIVTLSVTLGDARLAADVANRMAELLNVYNLERRQSTSREQRRFVANRLAQAEGELRDASLAQTNFLAENRVFGGSPALEEKASRLAREVLLRQEVVLSLRKAFEDARIAEVRDTPVLTIVDHAAPADRPTSPRPVLWTVLGAVLGVLAAASAALVSARWPRARGEAAALEGARRAAAARDPALPAVASASHPEAWGTAQPRR